MNARVFLQSFVKEDILHNICIETLEVYNAFNTVLNRNYIIKKEKMSMTDYKAGTLDYKICINLIAILVQKEQEVH